MQYMFDFSQCFMHWCLSSVAEWHCYRNDKTKYLKTGFRLWDLKDAHFIVKPVAIFSSEFVHLFSVSALQDDTQFISKFLRTFSGPKTLISYHIPIILTVSHKLFHKVFNILFFSHGKNEFTGNIFTVLHSPRWLSKVYPSFPLSLLTQTSGVILPGGSQQTAGSQ